MCLVNPSRSWSMSASLLVAEIVIAGVMALGCGASTRPNAEGRRRYHRGRSAWGVAQSTTPTATSPSRQMW